MSNIILYSQSSTFTYPTNEQQDVELIPNIIIMTDYKIDSSSIKSFYFTPDSGEYDFNYSQSILILPVYYSENLADSLLNKVSVIGDYQLVDTNVLSFTPRRELNAGSEYVCILKNLRIIEPENGDTISVSENSVTFTTTYPAHEIVMNPYKNNANVKCNDTLWVMFNRPIDETTSTLGDIITLKIIDSTDIINDTLIRFTSPCSLFLFVDTENNKVVKAIPSSNLTPGKEYLLNVNPGYFSGDSASNEESVISVRSKFKISMDIKVVDSNETINDYCTIPRKGNTFYNYYDSVKVFAEEKVADKIFIRWECPNDSTIDSLQDYSFTINQNCGNLEDYYITAVYKLKDTVDCVVNANTSLTVSVYDNSMQYLGSSGTFSIPVDEFIYVAIEGDANNKFNYWSSSEQYLNEPDNYESVALKGNETPQTTVKDNNSLLKVFNMGRDIDLMGNLQPYPPKPNYGINFQTYFSKPQTDDYKTDLPQSQGYLKIYVNDVPITGTSYSSGEQSENVDVSFKVIKQPETCYSPTYLIFISDIEQTDGTYWDAPRPPYPDSIKLFGVPTTSAFSDIITEISTERLDTYTLTINADWESINNLATGELGEDVTVIAEVLIGNEVIDTKTIKPDENPIEIQCFCDQEVRLTAKSNLKSNGFKFVEWDDLSPNTAPSPNTLESWKITVDGDKYVRAVFSEGFRLTDIGLYLDEDRNSATHVTTPNFFSANEIIDNENFFLGNIEVWDHTEDEDIGYESKILLKFNAPIQATDFHNKIIITELTKRVDDHSIGDEFNQITYTLDGSNCVVNPTEFPDENVLTIWIRKDNNLLSNAIPKGEQFKIDILDGIINTRNCNDNCELENPGIYKTFETEIPGINLFMESVYLWCYDPNGFWNNTNEIFIPWACSILKFNLESKYYNILNIYNNQYPDDGYKIVDFYSILKMDCKMFETNQMFNTDLITVLYGIYEYDFWFTPGDYSEEFKNKLQDLNSEFIDYYNQLYIDFKKKDFDYSNPLWSKLLYGLLRLILDVMAGGFGSALAGSKLSQTIVETWEYWLVITFAAILFLLVETWFTDKITNKGIIYDWYKNQFGVKSRHILGFDTASENINFKTKLKKKELIGSEDYY